MNRAKWFKVHSWVGVKLSILLCFVLITGTFAVLSNELDWLSNSAMRVAPKTVSTINWVDIYQQALIEAKARERQIIRLSKPIDPWFAAQAIIINQNSRLPHRLFFHPSTGDYLGDGRYLNWQRFFRDSHRYLMFVVATTVGLTIVCSLGILMLISVITSFVVYKGWWRGFLRLPRRQNRKVFWADLHRLFGVWVIWLILLESLTGIWYLSERYGLRAPKPERIAMQPLQAPESELQTQLSKPLAPAPAKANNSKAKDQQKAKREQEIILPNIDTFSQIISQSSSYYPELKIEQIVFDAEYGVLLQGQGDAILVRARANEISFHSQTGEFLSINKGQDLSIHGRISEAADPLHFGTFAGIYSKIVYFVFGLMLSTVAISGTYIYGMRVAKISRDEARPNKKIWTSAIATMGWGKWLSYIALTICAVITIILFGGIYP